MPQSGQAYLSTSTTGSDDLSDREDINDTAQASGSCTTTVCCWSYMLIVLAGEMVAGLVLHIEASVAALVTEESVEAEGNESATFRRLILCINEGSA
jgi:hypothetical protein